MRFLQKFLLLGTLLSLPWWVASHSRAAEPTAEIVVANRYLQQSGTSHSHLYLYRADGRLLRQLTTDGSGQDRRPVFAPDGETIVFTRELPGGAKQYWSIEPLGKNLHLLDVPPEWYVQAKSAPSFNHYFGKKEGELANEPTDARNRSFQFTETNPPMEVVLTPSVKADPEVLDDWNVQLRGADGKGTKLGTLPGWAPGLLGCQADGQEKKALVAGNVRTAFFNSSLGSTDGATTHAISLDGKRMVRLARNEALPFPLPGEPAFLVSAEERYVPFGDRSHTANCEYVDRWDGALQRVRYARENAAAIHYGASMYRPGKTPAVITILPGED